MNNAKILIVDIDILTSQILKSILHTNGYETTIVRDGEKALEILKETEFPLVITELIIPGINGKELIQELKKTAAEPMIIIQSYSSEKDKISEIMALGIQDYFLKPIRREEALFKVNRAFDKLKENRDDKNLPEKNRGSEPEIKRFLDWKIWKENILKRDSSLSEKSLFYNIKTSICQGAGFGALVSLLSLVNDNAREENDKYIIDKSLMQIVFNNNLVVKGILDQLTEIADIVDTEPSLSDISISDLQKILRKEAQRKKNKARIKNQKIHLKLVDAESENLNIAGNHDLLEKVFLELIINAFKFSKRDSILRIAFQVINDKVNISFISVPEKTSGNILGIPLKYENLVFNPFFRLSKVVFEEYQSLDFGLGLTAVSNIIAKHNGVIFAFNDKEAGEDSPQINVNISIQLPVKKG